MEAVSMETMSHNPEAGPTMVGEATPVPREASPEESGKAI